jgi:hypothetical protein
MGRQYYPIDTALLERFDRAFNDVGEKAAAREGRDWPAILRAEIQRRHIAGRRADRARPLGEPRLGFSAPAEDRCSLWVLPPLANFLRPAARCPAAVANQVACVLCPRPTNRFGAICQRRLLQLGTNKLCRRLLAE